MGYRVDISRVTKGLGEAKLKTMFAVEKYGRAACTKLEQKAKDKAGWTDRTGLARQTIAGTADWAGNVFRIGVTGNMNYSPYLELAMEKRFAILWPTIREEAPEILRGLGGLL